MNLNCKQLFHTNKGLSPNFAKQIYGNQSTSIPLEIIRKFTHICLRLKVKFGDDP